MYTGIRQGSTYTYPASAPEPVLDLFRRVMTVTAYVMADGGFSPSHLIVHYEKQAYRLDIEPPPPVKAKEPA